MEQHIVSRGVLTIVVEKRNDRIKRLPPLPLEMVQQSLHAEIAREGELADGLERCIGRELLVYDRPADLPHVASDSATGLPECAVEEGRKISVL